jgi:selenoprotein W-related protein
VWCRKADAGFPELAELKRRIRDRIAPGKSLGHSEGA